MKQLLIDAIYITGGGGTTLLAYLLEKLSQNAQKVTCLIDNRIADKFPNLYNHLFINLPNSESERKKFYKANADKYSIILCFSNVPPPLKLEIPVFTFFQNKLLLTDSFKAGFRVALGFWIKRIYIFINKKNSDLWIVQTNHMKQGLNKKLLINNRKILTLPFFPGGEDKKLEKGNNKKNNSFFYITSDTKYKNNYLLVKTWIDLYNGGFRDIQLILTLKKDYYTKLVKSFKNLPPNITNLEYLPYNHVENLYSENKYLIFASLVESFGLPLIEAYQHSCDIIAPDLPYVNEIIIPTYSFDPYNSKSLYDIIIKTQKIEDVTGHDTKLLVEDKVDDLIKLLMFPSFE